MTSLRLVAALLLPLALAAPALAADRHVPTATYPTIASAVAVAQPGDRIVVGPGVYQEHVVSAVADLTFVGRRAIWDGTLADGSTGTCLAATGGATVVQGFTFRAGDFALPHLDLTGDDCRVVRCDFRGTDTRMVRISGARARVTGCSLVGGRGIAFEIVGDDAVVERLTATLTDGAVVMVTGARARLARNRFDIGDDGAGLGVLGDAAVVVGNRFTDCERGVNVTGNGCLVEGNRCSGGGDVVVTGDGVTVRRNSFAGGAYRVPLRIESATDTGGGVVEDNVLDRISVTAIDLRCRNVTVQHNRVTRAGTESEAGILLNTAATANHLLRNHVAGCDAHAYDVRGPDNVIEECVAADCTADGFHVNSSGTTLTRCRATGCGGEGLDNGGADTTVTDCRFLRNRLDVANDGSFANFGSGNVFVTGGTGQAPQVD